MTENLEQSKWDNFVISSPEGSFLQSWSWGELQQELGFDHWRLSEEADGKVVGQALVIKRDLPMGLSWLYVPRGPVISPLDKGENKRGFSVVLDQIIDLAKEQKSVFVRIEPDGSATPPLAGGEKLWRPGRSVQPKNTLILDLNESEEDLLANMHQKTRYNIRLAEKKGVTVRFSREEKDLEAFFKIASDVTSRSNFHYHPDKYYRKMLQTVPHTELAVAEHEGDILAVNIIISFHDTATYTHGASSSHKRELMAPHLLQWESIKRAKNHGFKKYDFYGIAPKEFSSSARGGGSHPWQGITRFKMGFGGTRVDYLETFDYVLRPMAYRLYNLMHDIKK